MLKHIRTEIIINAPRELVWDLLTDFNAYPQWNPFLISVEGVLVQDGRLNCVIQGASGKMNFSPVIKKIRRCSYFSWKGKLLFPGLFDGYHYFKIEEQGPGTVKFIQGERFSGLLSRFILKKIKDQTTAGFNRMNLSLKELAEHKPQTS